VRKANEGLDRRYKNYDEKHREYSANGVSKLNAQLHVVFDEPFLEHASTANNESAEHWHQLTVDVCQNWIDRQIATQHCSVQIETDHA
jgi:hypothetical protein